MLGSNFRNMKTKSDWLKNLPELNKPQRGDQNSRQKQLNITKEEHTTVRIKQAIVTLFVVWLISSYKLRHSQTFFTVGLMSLLLHKILKPIVNNKIK